MVLKYPTLRLFGTAKFFWWGFLHTFCLFTLIRITVQKCTYTEINQIGKTPCFVRNIKVIKG